MTQIRIRDAVPRLAEFRFAEPVDWTVRPDENWAVIGPNGGGKTLLTDLLQGRIALREGSVETDDVSGRPFYELVRSISFRDIYSLADPGNGYYQQRWNATDAAESPLAGSLLPDAPPALTERCVRLFGIGDLLEKRLVSLSSGELRKFLISRVLVTEPHVLILDNPFIGLDAASREVLDTMLRRIVSDGSVQVILVLSNPDDIPAWITHVLPIADKTLLPTASRTDFLRDGRLLKKLFPERYDAPETHPPILPAPIGKPDGESCDPVIGMESVTVRYGPYTILDGVDWQVLRGEKWALLGENGSGKSTLLSLVYGDNPQAYANRLVLFGRRRGTGESIWDIKRRIGYLSPDVHTYYLKNIPALEVVASGFYDSVGLYRNPAPEQLANAEEWLRALGASHLKDRSFIKLSYGEQRLVLIARALVKDPDLLILDEPLHGLDTGKKTRVRRLIDAFVSRPDKTLIYVTHYPEEIPESVTRRKILTRPGSKK